MPATDDHERGWLESTTTAILMLLLRSQQEREGEGGDEGDIEALLYRSGFTKQADIVALTGTPRSTVSRRLKSQGLT